MKPKWKLILNDWLRVVGISILIGIFISFIFAGSDIFTYSWHRFKILITISLIIGIAMWKGNQLIQTILGQKYPWSKNPTKAFRMNIILTSIHNTLVLFIINTLIFAYFAKGKFSFIGSLDGILINTIIVSLISFFIWMVMFVRKFFDGYKNNILKEEQHKRELAISQYEMLKNQVNPHFLFNSLNVLTSLVENDPTTAVRFIKKLSEVYRYVLEAKDKELVPLEDELRLTESFIYLQKIRNGESLNVTISVAPAGKKVVPLALQMVVENAIKHNIIAASQPLTIRIYEDAEGNLTCENNLQKKQVIADSNTIGLKNIEERYSFLTEKKMQYGEDNGQFTVRIPLI